MTAIENARTEFRQGHIAHIPSWFIQDFRQDGMELETVEDDDVTFAMIVNGRVLTFTAQFIDMLRTTRGGDNAIFIF